MGWLFWLIVGIVLGTIFHAVFSKWYNKAKVAGQELAKDVKTELDKQKTK